MLCVGLGSVHPAYTPPHLKSSVTPTTSIIHIHPHPPMPNPPASIRPPSVQVALFLVDDLCVLSGLGARPELNGCGGRVIAGGAGGIGPDAASGRYGARIHVETTARRPTRFGQSGRYGARHAPRVAPGCGQPRPIGRLGRAVRPWRAAFSSQVRIELPLAHRGTLIRARLENLRLAPQSLAAQITAITSGPR